ncbi:Gfo/Idh/MocA family protein [Spirosoma flavum]|uniref:Gfo/Idh/MocA family protein n=1 Tax=Spirosoma flavum TaxID=2048557 RepID=A0ABW6AB64_9BACT
MRIGLIGCGRWGKLILTTLTKLSVPVMVVDLDPENCRQAMVLGAVATASSVQSLQVSDGLIVATPASTHRSVLEQIAHLGQPIFIEKPLATSYDDALAIGRLPLPPTFLMHIWRYHPGVRLLGDIGQSGKLGQVLFVKTIRTNWTSPRTDTDSLRTLAPHDLTIFLQILGYIPTPKAAIAERHNGQIRGLTAFLGEDPACIMEVSTRYADKRREVRLHGTQGVAVLTDEKTDYIDIWYGSDQTMATDRHHERLFYDATPPLQLELMAFLEYLRGGKAPVSSLLEGIEITRLIDAIEQLI